MWKYYALASAAFAAATAITSKLGARDVPSNLATAIRTFVVLIMAWGIVFARGEQTGLRDLPRPALVWLVVSGFATGASWLCYFRALSEGPISVVQPLDKLSLPLTIILGIAILGEAWSWRTIAAIIFIGCGTWLLMPPVK